MNTVEPADATPAQAPVAGRYRLGRVIGIGSSAEVRRGWDLRDGGAVAVKLFRVGASAHDWLQQRRELAALARLRHPGLVGLHDGGTEGGRPFVVTDLVDGPTLAERIRNGPLTPRQVRRLGARLADALAHVHAGGIVHRDVKPANVLLGDGGPRLADFGIARVLDGTAATTAGCVVGTAAYLAPEQARGEDVGPPADVYALGLVLLEALTGRREYPGLAVESATARLHRPPAVPDALPGGLTTVLRSMTADEPSDRPTAADVVVALSRRPAATDDPEGRVGLGRHRRSASRARMAAPLAAAALVLAVFGGAVAVLADPPAPTVPAATPSELVAPGESQR